ncbi:MAG TPA: hypothetical protein VKZ41_04830 [Gemmatimonadales bacterium]|nr:hypothetical protein [Gemmatimonadales bacterium]
MSMKETAKTQRLGALGAYGGAAAILVLWAVVFFWLAGSRVSTSGIDVDHSLLIRLTTFFPALAIAAVHFAVGRQLSAAAGSWQGREA